MRIHFIAIGGSAMHNLAIALHNNGHIITGSDDEIFEPSRSRLSHYGLLPEEQGWFPEKISTELDAVILGMHARKDNPELMRASELGIKIFSYPEYLYYHSRDKKRIVIGGSHGKTTITGMVMHVLKSMGYDFDYMVGSKLKDFDVMVKISESAPVMIFEGDEYLTSPVDTRPKFHWYRPHIALLTGIAWDHINVFPTFEKYREQFEIFISLIQKNGTLVYCDTDKELNALVEKHAAELHCKPYHLPDYKVNNSGVTSIVSSGRSYPLRIFGEHNLQNTNGARLICNELGISDEDFFSSIISFEGTANRLELMAKKGDNFFYKDFAHAPSKVSATVKAVREQFPQHKLVVCFELHTFSSLNQNFLSEYRGSLDPADEACVYFNPHALELKRLPPLDKEKVLESFDNEKLAIFADAKKMVSWLKQQKGDRNVYLCMSSGNFDGTDLVHISEYLV